MENLNEKSTNMAMIKYLIKLYLGIVAQEGSLLPQRCCENYRQCLREIDVFNLIKLNLVLFVKTVIYKEITGIKLC